MYVKPVAVGCNVKVDFTQSLGIAQFHVLFVDAISRLITIQLTKSIITVSLSVPRILWHLFAVFQIEHEIEILIFQGAANVIGGLLPIAANIDRTVVWRHGIVGKLRNINFLALRRIDRGPCHHIGIQQGRAGDKVGTVGAVGTIAVFALDAIHLATAFGDDIHHSSQSHVTVQ